LAGGVLEQLTNVISVGLNYTMAAALTADGRVIEFGRSGLEPPPPLTNVIAIDVSGQFNDDDLDYRLAVTATPVVSVDIIFVRARQRFPSGYSRRGVVAILWR